MLSWGSLVRKSNLSSLGNPYCENIQLLLLQPGGLGQTQIDQKPIPFPINIAFHAQQTSLSRGSSLISSKGISSKYAMASVQTINIMSFSQYTSQIKETLNCFQAMIGEGQSPIAPPHPETPSFRPEHQRNPSEGVSIEQDINSFVSPYPKYKCFHCFGLHNNLQMHGSAPLCQECDGSEYINQAHPLVSLYAKILKIKVAPLLKSSSPTDKSTQQIYCSNCLQVFDENSYTCENRSDYSLCQCCYEQNKYLHLQGHTFKNNRTKTLFRLRQTMKKISQEHQSEECGTLGDQLFCSLCSQLIQECYQLCQNCSQGGPLFMICSNCNQSTAHDPTHSLSLMTNNRGSKSLGLVYKSSESKSQGSYLSNMAQSNMAQSMQYEEIEGDNSSSLAEMASQTGPDIDLSRLKRPEQLQTQSIVCIPTLSLEQSCQYVDQINPITPPECQSPYYKVKDHSQTDSLSFSQNLSINPENSEPPSPLPQRKDPQRKTDSLIRIKLDDSLDHVGLTHELGRISAQSSLPRSSNFIIKERSHYEIEEEDYLFNNYQCDICEVYPIRNIRFHCKECEDYDICKECHRERRSEHPHSFEEVNGKTQQRERQQKALQITNRHSGMPQRKSRMSFKSPFFH